MLPSQEMSTNPLSAAAKRGHHIGSLDSSAHVLVFRAKEGSRDVALLVLFAVNIPESIAGNVDLVVDVTSIEPTF